MDQFTDRLAHVRRRFAASLEQKIATTCDELVSLSGDSSAVAEAVAETYRRIHGIAGVGGTVGFTAAASAAHEVERVLLLAYRARRGLDPQEVATLGTRLRGLREAARRELQAIGSAWR